MIAKKMEILDSNQMDNEKFPYAEIGARLRFLRERTGLNQTAFAKNIGLIVTSYSALETGQRIIRTEHLIRLIEAYDADADFILFGKTSALSEAMRKEWYGKSQNK